MKQHKYTTMYEKSLKPTSDVNNTVNHVSASVNTALESWSQQELY